MKSPLHLDRGAVAAVVTVAAVVFATVLLKPGSGQSASASRPQGPVLASELSKSEATVELSPKQVNAITIQALGTYHFPVEKEAVGSIDYDEDLSVQVFSPYQGKIIAAFANLGDKVQKGEPLYTIDSPDLIQAASTLIGAEANFELTSKELARARELSGPNGVSEREIEQATSR